MKDKAAESFLFLQMGVACHAGGALDGQGFLLCQFLMTVFLELLPWVCWHYGTHPLLVQTVRDKS